MNININHPVNRNHHIIYIFITSTIWRATLKCWHVHWIRDVDRTATALTLLSSQIVEAKATQRETLERCKSSGRKWHWCMVWWRSALMMLCIATIVICTKRVDSHPKCDINMLLVTLIILEKRIEHHTHTSYTVAQLIICEIVHHMLFCKLGKGVRQPKTVTRKCNHISIHVCITMLSNGINKNWSTMIALQYEIQQIIIGVHNNSAVWIS